MAKAAAKKEKKAVKEELSKAQIKRYLEEEHYTQLHVLFEIVGNPKTHVENTLKNYLATIASEDEVYIIKEKFSSPEEKDGLWSLYAETDILIKNLTKVTWLAFNYMPASIEVVKPTQFDVHAREMQEWLNDMLAKLHEVSMVAKEHTAQRQTMSTNLARLAMNVVLQGVKRGMKLSEIAKDYGLQKEDVIKFAEILVKEKKITLNKTKSEGKAKKK